MELVVLHQNWQAAVRRALLLESLGSGIRDKARASAMTASYQTGFLEVSILQYQVSQEGRWEGHDLRLFSPKALERLTGTFAGTVLFRNMGSGIGVPAEVLYARRVLRKFHEESKRKSDAQ